MLREHGDRSGRMEYLKKGLNQINKKVISDSIELVDRENALAEKEAALKELRALVKQ